MFSGSKLLSDLSEMLNDRQRCMVPGLEKLGRHLKELAQHKLLNVLGKPDLDSHMKFYKKRVLFCKKYVNFSLKLRIK